MRGAAVPVCALLLAAALSAEDVVVAHPTVPVAMLDQGALRDVFLGRRTTWGGGVQVVVVLQRDGEAKERLGARLGKTPQQLINWWKRLVFTGDGSMPEVVEGTAAVLAKVAAVPGAIGWIERPEVPPDGVRLIPAP